MKSHLRLSGVSVLALILSAALVGVMPGASGPPAKKPVKSNKQPIVIGTTTSLTGSVSVEGISGLDGAEAYFDKVNAAGGVNGHKIKLIALDDGLQTAQR